MQPRRKQAGGRKFNTNSLSLEDIQQVVAYLVNFAEDHALVLPGRVPGYKRTDLKLLPSSETKASVWRQYQVAVVAFGKCSFIKCEKQKSFQHYVKNKCPVNVKICMISSEMIIFFNSWHNLHVLFLRMLLV